MTNKYILIAGFLFVGCCCFFAIKSTTPKYGFVDSKTVFDGFNGKKELERDLEELGKKQTQILDSLKNEVIKAETNNDEKLDTKRAFYLQIEQEFLKENQEKSAEYTRKIWLQIREYSSDFGKKQDLDFIYGLKESGDVLFSNSEKDLTKELVEHINKKYEGK